MKAFWSFTLNDHQTRSMLQMPQKCRRSGGQSYLTPAATAVADDSTVVHFSPEKPEGVADDDWIQTDPDKGCFNILRLCGLMPNFFDKPGQLSGVELVE